MAVGESVTLATWVTLIIHHRRGERTFEIAFVVDFLKLYSNAPPSGAPATDRTSETGLKN